MLKRRVSLLGVPYRYVTMVWYEDGETNCVRKGQGKEEEKEEEEETRKNR